MNARLAGLGAPPGEALYAATKHGAIAFSLGSLADLRRAGFKGIHVSAVCPDGIWTPMIADKLDDPDAARAELARGDELRSQLWSQSVRVAGQPGGEAAQRSLLPALNQMFEIATTRTRAFFAHTPPVITAWPAFASARPSSSA